MRDRLEAAAYAAESSSDEEHTPTREEFLAACDAFFCSPAAPRSPVLRPWQEIAAEVFERLNLSDDAPLAPLVPELDSYELKVVRDTTITAKVARRDIKAATPVFASVPQLVPVLEYYRAQVKVQKHRLLASVLQPFLEPMDPPTRFDLSSYFSAEEVSSCSLTSKDLCFTVAGIQNKLVLRHKPPQFLNRTFNDFTEFLDHMSFQVAQLSEALSRISSSNSAASECLDHLLAAFIEEFSAVSGSLQQRVSAVQSLVDSIKVLADPSALVFACCYQEL
jgi:hypothetical protein